MNLKLYLQEVDLFIRDVNHDGNAWEQLGMPLVDMEHLETFGSKSFMSMINSEFEIIINCC